MSLLESIIGQGEEAVSDYLRRYDRGGTEISDEEARQHYGTVSSELEPEQYVDAAKEALGKMTPEQRIELVESMRSEARRQDFSFPELHEDSRLHEPQSLAGFFAHMERNRPGVLQQLTGSHPLAKMALAGIAAYGMRRLMKR